MGLYDLIYAKPSDNVAPSATVTQETGTTNSLFPLSRVYDLDPATATKSTGTGDYALQYAYGGAQRVDGVWIPMYNFPAATTIRFQGNASAAWGAPTLDATYVVPAYGGDLPVGIFIDLRGVTGYSTSGFQYWRLKVPNPSKVTAVGEVWMASTVRTIPNLFRGIQRPRTRNVITHPRNDGGLFKYDRGTDTWQVTGKVRANTTTYAAVLSLYQDCRGALYPFPVVLDTHLAQPEGFLVQWAAPFSPTNTAANREMLDISWSMVNRGRAL